MARGDSGWGLIGFVIMVILLISQTIKGNFIPVLVILGIILVVYLYIKISDIAQSNKVNSQIEVNNTTKKDTNVKPYLLFFLVFGVIMIRIFFHNSSYSNGEQIAVPVENPVVSNEIVDTTAAIIKPSENITWNTNDFLNSKFQIPEKLILNEDNSSEQFKLYIDPVSNAAMSIYAGSLNDTLKNKTIDSFKYNLSNFANRINEGNKKKFGDFELLDYEFSYLGNLKAIKIEQRSKEVSGIKNIEMIMTSYYVISYPYFYSVTFSCPKEEQSYLETFERINKTFDFTELHDNEIVQKESKVANGIGYYTVKASSTNKVYFYNNPDENFKRKAYLIGGELVLVQDIINGFGFVNYTNSRGLSTKGWVKMSSLLNSTN